MTSPSDVRRIPAERLRTFTCQALQASGFSNDEARIGADVIVEADVRGVDTHGVTRLAGYVNMTRLGYIKPRARWQVVNDGPTTALIDGDGGLGQYLGHLAMERAIAKARGLGLGAVAVRNGTHNGMNAYYPLMAVRAGLIGFAFTQGPAIVPPFGGKTPAVATNPLSIGAPAERHEHVLVDMATTVVAGGKIRLAAKKGQPIPPTWALDGEGRPTTDPEAALKGFFQWAGGYKGYALAVMVEVLSSVLAGGLFARQVPPMRVFGQQPLIESFLVMALDISRFMPLDEFRQRVDALVDDLTSCERAAGVERILVPGQPEREMRAERLANGVPVSAAVCAELEQLARDLKLPSPLG
ncbi:MAG: Ldh family oxidoreductase [Chloroflexi bacterium]|nr:Ldh family oxidoreductase [Chloroflexota bacterium]